jgi:hypothetical protein
MEQDIKKLIEYIRATCYVWNNDMKGWAPQNTIQYLEKMNYDRVLPMSESMHRYNKDDINEVDLILGWTTLGAIIEWYLRFFLTVYSKDYLRNPKFNYVVKTSGDQDDEFVVDPKLIEPGVLAFSEARAVCKENDILTKSERRTLNTIQENRNIIHLNIIREIKDYTTFKRTIKEAGDIVEKLSYCIPWPGDIPLTNYYEEVHKALDEDGKEEVIYHNRKFI